jgi:hypothetical protein
VIGVSPNSVTVRLSVCCQGSARSSFSVAIQVVIAPFMMTDWRVIPPAHGFLNVIVAVFGGLVVDGSIVVVVVVVVVVEISRFLSLCLEGVL